MSPTMVLDKIGIYSSSTNWFQLHDPGNFLIGHTGPACDNDKMFYPSEVQRSVKEPF
jgi:hypothetical protein